MSAVPNQVLYEMGRLNSHARAWGSGKRAIYAYKELLVHQLLDADALGVRNVVFVGQCGRCEGTGIYRDWDGYVRGTCHHCTKGIVRLRFAETTLPDGQVWHHPVGHAGDSGRAVLERIHKPNPDDWEWLNRLDWPQTVDWKPRTRGEPMVGDTLARSLNVVEDWLLDLDSTDWKHKFALRRLWGYSIRLGRAPFDVCWVCQSPATDNLGCPKWPFDFSAPACKAHNRDWPDHPHPILLTPEVLRWAQRRPMRPPNDFDGDRW